MNLHELDRYKLSDAVKFNTRLNPRLWGRDEHLKPEVRDALIKIADDFRQSLGVKDLDLKDITLSGSNAAYTYTPNSDIDLHLVVDTPDDPVYRELFDAKKYAYNNQHNIKIGGYDVELYVQDVDQPHTTQGEYSLLDNDWIQVPRRQRADVVDQSTKSKYQDLKQRIKAAIKTQDHEVLAGLMAKIKQLRQSGLDEHGEFGPENLAFKMLRTQGYIQQLVDARNAAKDQELSIDERVQPRVTYGFATESKDDLSDTINQFARSCIEYLGIEKAPEIQLHTNTDWSEHTGSFGQYEPETNVLHLATAGRHTLDILRTMAHEFTHRKQAEQQTLPADAGETGSPYEDEANAMAGRIMRHWAEKHPEMFAHVPLEEASGYIPTRKQARDPRFVMALTKDVRPGQTGKEANKLGLQTDAQGHPALLTATLNESQGRSKGKVVVKPSPGKGNGLFATKPIKTGEVITRSEFTTIDDNDWDLIKNTTPVKLYGFKLGNKHALQKGPFKFQFDNQKEKALWNKTKFKDLSLSGFMFVNGADSPDEVNSEEKFSGNTAEMIATKDIKPGEEIIKQYNVSTKGVAEHSLAHSLGQELREFKDQDLFEIRMSTANLRQEAAKTGALAGMEFEMIVPNVQGDPQDFESEPDYDRDERCRSIDDACQFFYDGNQNSRRDIDRLRESMNEDYLEWLDGKIESEWDDRGEEYIAEWVANNVNEDEWNPDELEGDERAEALEEFATNVHADPMGDYYQQARDEFREDNQEDYDESDWLDSEGLGRMTGVENAYNINWPYWTEPGDGYGQAEISDVAQDFENAIGRDVFAADSYHSSGTLRPSPSRIRYVVEPDSSLEPDNDSDKGLEFVSPPLPIDEILSDLNKVRKWARAYGCYTNDSTGLHINISVPDYSRQNLDFVKLALLMGDKYVLDLFGRAGNTYARSALDIVKRQVRDDPEGAEALLNKMKGNLDQLATKAIHSGITGKYTSINTKDGHIEFRSPGGDWLDQNFDQIENTLLRFTVAMSAALNPKAYREEYLKKLYKLLSENNRDTDTIRYFSDYVAGKIPRAALRSFVKQAQLERKLKRGGKDIKDSGGATLNGRPSNPDGRYVIVPEQDRQTVVYRFEAAGPDDAAIVLRQWRQAHPDQVWVTLRDDRGVLGQPAGSDTPRFGLWDLGEGGFINSRGEVGQGGRLLGGDSEQAARTAGASSGLGHRMVMGEIVVRRIPEQPQSAATTSENQGNWGIWIASSGRFARMPGQTDNSVLQRFPSRSAAHQYLDQYRRENAGARNDLEVREIEPGQSLPDLFPELPRRSVNQLSQTDIENRLGWGNQAADANYEVVNRATMQPVFRFIANTPEEANTKYGQILQAMGMPTNTEDYGYRDIVVPGSTIDLQRRRAAAASDNVFGIGGQSTNRTDGRVINYGPQTTEPINYELYNRLTDQVIDTFPARNDREAQTRLNDYRQFGAGQGSPDHFGVRRGPGVDNTGAQTQDQQQGGIVDVAPDVAQNFPAQGREFIGWNMINQDGDVEGTILGIGNSQADANRYAQQWLARSRRNDIQSLEVVPVWREA